METEIEKSGCNQKKLDEISDLTETSKTRIEKAQNYCNNPNKNRQCKNEVNPSKDAIYAAIRLKNQCWVSKWKHKMIFFK